MANFVPAGLECDDDFDDDMFDDDEDDEFDEPFVRKTSQTQSSTKQSADTRKPPPGWGNWRTSERADIVSGSNAVDDFRLAVTNGNVDAIKQYLDQGVQVDQRFSTGWTALMHASNGCNPQVVRLLLERGADPNYACDKFSVLMAFCGSNYHQEPNIFDCVNQLLEHNADVNAFDRYHVTPLIQASRKDRMRVVAALIEAGADVDKQDNRGNTALMAASLHGHVRVVRTLLEHNADVNKRSFDGSTAAEIAVTNGHTKIMELLERVSGIEDVQKKLVLTEDDVQEIEAAAAKGKDSGSGSLLGKNLENGVTQYGELEMLLAGLCLTDLIGLFHEQEVSFEDVLRMTDQDLVKMGVTRLGNRKKILDAVHSIHKKEWLPNSLTAMQYTKKVTSVETVNMIQNLKKHVSYIGSTVGYVADHIRADSSILLQAQEGSGANELASHTEEAMNNVHNLYRELTILRTHLAKLVGDEAYQPADLIKPRRKKSSARSRLRVLVKSSVVLGVIGVLVWKSDSLVEAVWKLKS